MCCVAWAGPRPRPAPMCCGRWELPINRRLHIFSMGESHENPTKNGNFQKILFQVLPLSISVMKAGGTVLLEDMEIEAEEDEEDQEIRIVCPKPRITRYIEPKIDYTNTKWYKKYANALVTSDVLHFKCWGKNFA